MVPRVRQSDPLEAARAELARLRQADDWDEPTPLQVMVNMPPAAKRTTPPAPAPSSLQVVLQVGRDAVHRMPAWGVVVVSVVGIAAWVYLAVHGKAPIP